MKRTNYYSDDEWEKLLEFTENLPTPFIVINLERVRKQYEELTKCFPKSRIYYSVKANPAIEINSLLHQLESHFDIASIYEMDKLLALGVPPEKMLYGNTIKKASDISYAYQKGLRLFATDCLCDLEKIAANAPGSGIYVRILVEGEATADWPLSKKFGCHSSESLSLLETALNLGLKPYGVSFHVGSQQRSVKQWNKALATVAQIFSMTCQKGIKLEMVNIGGGFPADYINEAPNIKHYAAGIHQYLHENFHGHIPEVILEPGRYLVGNAGILVSEIITVAKKHRSDNHRWVYQDAGKFNGLIETLGEDIKYPVVMSEHYENSQEGEVVLAGPTCDSVDILYEKNRYKLPMDILPGQRLYWLSTGAYTASYASVEFNGFPPIKTYFMDS
jgi:ornithine decarboxylase